MKQTIPVIKRIEQAGQPKAWIKVNSKLSFASPSFGPGTYTQVGKQILEMGLAFPTGDDTAELLYATYCIPEVKKEKEFQNIREIMIDGRLWVGNRKLWTSKGVYVLQDKQAVGRSKPLDIKDLEKALKGGRELSWGGIRFSLDGKVRFAPKGSYKLGEHTSDSLTKDGDVIASYNIEGAEKLGEVSSKFRINPYTYGLYISSGQAPEQRLSAVGDGGFSLDLDSSYFDDDEGYALGNCLK